jgi:hypothetical protein
MPLIELLTIEGGAAIGKSILKLWLKDPIASDVGASILDVVKTRVSDQVAQKRSARQFEAIGEKVAEQLLPIFESESARLDEGSCKAVVFALVETLNTAGISAELLAEHNLDPTRYAKYLLGAAPSTARQFSSDEHALYERSVREASQYIVDIASQLPAFTEQTLAQVLKREGVLLERTEQILQEVRKLREQLNPAEAAAHFELDYRRAVTRNLDVLELFGTDVSSTSRRHRLSTAYITLSVEPQAQLPAGQEARLSPAGSAVDPSEEEDERPVIPVSEALTQSSHWLIRGLAGSGKTTLLKWIAVQAATQSFTGSLAAWNTMLPFYIRLRQHVQQKLPTPETFPMLISPAIAEAIPRGWANDILASGRALVLVDGVDEVPEGQREDVRIWLNDLVGAYPEARFIITSRPYAITEGWLDNRLFADAELQQMSLDDIDAFIDHWHTAVKEEVQVPEEKAQLEPLALQLKGEIQRHHALRNLAATPLLCAMLCAMNRDRRQQLPKDRIELYEACCSMLLERRDLEQHIPLNDYPSLSYRQKCVLLEDLAYWLIRNGWSEIKTTEADERFQVKLQNLPEEHQGISGTKIRRLFVERTGMLREPVDGRLDFTHRTFQEYLAAKAALDQGDIGVLVNNATDDQWREIIILACGRALTPDREKLLTQLLERGDTEKEQQYQLHLLAVSCLETAPELGQELRAAVQQRLVQLVPPKKVADAKALAAAGDLAVPYLAQGLKYSATVTVACARALTLIGTEAALQLLETYTHDTRPSVKAEMLRAWDSFDPADYDKRIVSRIYPGTKISLSSSPRKSILRLFTRFTELDLSGCWQFSDLRPLAGLTQLTALDLSTRDGIDDLRPLAGLTRLASLDLGGCWQVTDLAPLAGLTQLTSLNLSGCVQITDLAPLAGLTQLTSLNLSGCVKTIDLAPLAGLTGLQIMR